MVRDPSIVSPSLTGVFIGGGHHKHGTGSRCTLPKQCRPPSPRRRWRCDRSSYKRSLFSRIRDSQMHYLTGPETIRDSIPSPSRIYVGSNHSGMGKPINSCLYRDRLWMLPHYCQCRRHSLAGAFCCIYVLITSRQASYCCWPFRSHMYLLRWSFVF